MHIHIVGDECAITQFMFQSSAAFWVFNTPTHCDLLLRKISRLQHSGLD